MNKSQMPFSLLTTCIFMLVSSIASVNAQDRSLENELKQALILEEAQRNVSGAVDLYESIIEKVEKDRKIAATALYRLAECYRKINQDTKAIEAYQKLIQQYPAEQSLVALSKQNLKALGQSPVSAQLSVNYDSNVPGNLNKNQVSNIIKLLHEELIILTRKKETAQVRVDTGQANESQLMDAELELLKLRQKLALYEGMSVQNEPEKLIRSDEEIEIARLKKLIETSPDLLSSPGSDGQSLLHSAVMNGYPRAAEIILKAGADVNNTSGSIQGVLPKITPLYLAIFRGDKSMVELLIKYGADIDAKVTVKYSSALEANKAPVSFPAPRITPLLLATERGFTEIIKLLIDKGAKVKEPENGISLVSTAVQHHDLNLVKLLVEAGSDPNLPGAILNKMSGNHTGSFQHFIAITTPLARAVTFKKYDIVEYLFQHDVDPNLDFRFPALYIALIANDSKMIRMLLNAKASADSEVYEDLNPLEFYLIKNYRKWDDDLISFMQSQGWKIRDRNHKNYTTILHSVFAPIFRNNEKAFPVARKMVELGVDPMALDAAGQLFSYSQKLMPDLVSDPHLLRKGNHIIYKHKVGEDGKVNQDYLVYQLDENFYNRYGLGELILLSSARLGLDLEATSYANLGGSSIKWFDTFARSSDRQRGKIVTQTTGSSHGHRISYNPYKITPFDKKGMEELVKEIQMKSGKHINLTINTGETSKNVILYAMLDISHLIPGYSFDQNLNTSWKPVLVKDFHFNNVISADLIEKLDLEIDLEKLDFQSVYIERFGKIDLSLFKQFQIPWLISGDQITLDIR